MMTTSSSPNSLGMPSSNIPLTLFNDIARTTWEWLGQARDRKLSFSEETITDIEALQIAGGVLNQVKVAKASRLEEKRYGIDWMWFIGNARQGYPRYAVQARKVTLDTSANFSYRLRHRVSRIPGSEFQTQRLERSARRARAIPLYCFYNNVDSALATRHWHCRVYTNRPDDIRQMGCTVVPLEAVQEVHKPNRRKDFCAVHRDNRSMPWRCLFHPSCLAAALHSKTDDHQGVLADRPSLDDRVSLGRTESLPEFLLQDDPVVEIGDVIQQLESAELHEVLDSDTMPTPGIQPAIPEWFVVIESVNSTVSLSTVRRPMRSTLSSQHVRRSRWCSHPHPHSRRLLQRH